MQYTAPDLLLNPSALVDPIITLNSNLKEITSCRAPTIQKIAKCHQVAQTMLALQGLHNCRDMLLVGHPLQSTLFVRRPKPHVVNPVHPSPCSKRRIAPDLGPHGGELKVRPIVHVHSPLAHTMLLRHTSMRSFSSRYRFTRWGFLSPLGISSSSLLAPMAVAEKSMYISHPLG